MGHFGSEMAVSLFGLEAAADWQGPLSSAFGEHLVLLTAKNPPREPPLQEVKSRVAQALIAERKREQKQRAIDALIAEFEVSYAADYTPAVNDQNTASNRAD